VTIRTHLASARHFVVYLYDQWNRLDIPKMSASLTFYTIVALAPLMVIFVAAAAFAFGSAAARDHLVAAVDLAIGDAGAVVIQALIVHAYGPKLGILATLLGGAALFFGATGAFIDLKGSLRIIWGVSDVAPGGLLAVLKERLLSFVMVLITGAVLVLSMFISLTLSSLHKYAGAWVPVTGIRIAEFVLSFAITTTVFAMIYRLVPPERMPWRHVLFGATVTATLFVIGKVLIATYLGTVAVGSSYGAAGSLFAFLLWLYYSSQVFLIGAVITRSRDRAERIGMAIHHQAPPVTGSTGEPPRRGPSSQPSRDARRERANEA
jgi:membrane protein